MEANLKKKILASIYLDGREICKKVYHLSNADYDCVVGKKDVFEVVSINDLADVRPLISSFRGDRVYLNPRYKIVQV